MSDWQPYGDGVMMYEPAVTTRSDVLDTASSYSDSGESERSLAFLASIETEGARDDSPTTLSPGSTHDKDTGKFQTWEETFLQDIKSYAENAPSTAEAAALSLVSRTDSTSPVDHDMDDINYATDGTDFLPVGETPCPSPRTQPSPRHEAGASSRQAFNPVFPSVKRRLWLGAPKARHSETQTLKERNPNEKLREIECSPRKIWSLADRELLCVLYRWLEASHRTHIPMVFAAMTKSKPGQKLEYIQTQFFAHCVHYAVPEYCLVFDSPFEPPIDQYRRLLDIAIQTSKQLKIMPGIVRRDEEPKSPGFVPGKAARSKSKYSRQRYNQITKSLSTSVSDSVRFSSGSFLKLGGYQIEAGVEDEVISDEVMSDATPAISLSLESTVKVKRQQSLGFRVWDASSRTAFSEERGFVANNFINWNGDYLQPPDTSTDEGLRFLMFVGTQHLSKQGGDGSGFVSVSNSLIQVVSMASKMENPYLSLIDLNHPKLQDPRRRFEASSLLKWAKGNGQATWAHYKGVSEWLFWASIPPQAVLSWIPLSKLSHLTHECSEILSFQYFQLDKSVPQVAALFRERKMPFQVDTARAIGEIAEACGLGGAHVNLDHIRYFVAALVDGWGLSADIEQLTDANTMHIFSLNFANSIKSRSRKHRLDDIMKAFGDGCWQAFETIQYYARRRRTKR